MHYGYDQTFFPSSSLQYLYSLLIFFIHINICNKLGIQHYSTVTVAIFSGAHSFAKKVVYSKWEDWRDQGSHHKDWWGELWCTILSTPKGIQRKKKPHKKMYPLSTTINRENELHTHTHIQVLLYYVKGYIILKYLCTRQVNSFPTSLTFWE